MRVLPFLPVIFFLTSVLAVPVPSSDSENGDEGLPALSSDWRIEVVDSEGAVYSHTSLAIDGNGEPHISYYKATSEDLKYANRTGLAWNTVTVDDGIRVGQYSSLALDKNGIPHISYYDQQNGDLRHANWTGGYWNIEIVDSEDDVGRCTSIAVDDSGYPRVVYPDLTNGDLKYANWTGTEWNIEIVDSYGVVGYSPSMTLDSRGYPHISYRNSTAMSLNYATWTGSGWDVTTVDSYGDVGKMTSIDLDSHEYPHISYLDSSGLPPYQGLKHANWTGDVWAIETVDSDGDVGGHSSIALDSDDNPHISYYNATLGDLKYAVWTGTEWSIETVDSYGIVGMWTSIALDGQDSPHISYLNYTSYDLKYATKADLTPSRSLTLDIDPDTLNLKSKGRWISARLSAENASVYDINTSSILLQDTLMPERYVYQGGILMLKFNRQELQSLLQVGDSIEIKIGGKWKDGESFEAYDYIRVICPGKK